MQIGETIADSDLPEALDLIHIDEPTLKVDFIVNDSPWARRSGKWLTMRNIASRLDRECITNVSLRVEPGETPIRLQCLVVVNCSLQYCSKPCVAKVTKSPSANRGPLPEL